MRNCALRSNTHRPNRLNIVPPIKTFTPSLPRSSTTKQAVVTTTQPKSQLTAHKPDRTGPILAISFGPKYVAESSTTTETILHRLTWYAGMPMARR